MHSPWVSRLLSELGHEVIVAHARNVRLIGESRRKDDRFDARTLARLARIDPQLLAPVQHRSAKAQSHLMVIRARAGLVRARTSLINTARGRRLWCHLCQTGQSTRMQRAVRLCRIEARGSSVRRSSDRSVADR
jgi:transposase